MRKGASDERKRFWRDLIGRQITSGLNIARFCAQVGVSQNSFYFWKRRLKAMAQQGRPSPRHRGQRNLAKSSSLVPVRLIPDLGKLPPAVQAIEVVWPSGLVLRVPAQGDAQTLHEVFGLITSTLNDEHGRC